MPPFNPLITRTLVPRSFVVGSRLFCSDPFHFPPRSQFLLLTISSSRPTFAFIQPFLLARYNIIGLCTTRCTALGFIRLEVSHITYRGGEPSEHKEMMAPKTVTTGRPRRDIFGLDPGGTHLLFNVSWLTLIHNSRACLLLPHGNNYCPHVGRERGGSLPGPSFRLFWHFQYPWIRSVVSPLLWPTRARWTLIPTNMRNGGHTD